MAGGGIVASAKVEQIVRTSRRFMGVTHLSFADARLPGGRRAAHYVRAGADDRAAGPVRSLLRTLRESHVRLGRGFPFSLLGTITLYTDPLPAGPGFVVAWRFQLPSGVRAVCVDAKPMGPPRFGDILPTLVHELTPVLRQKHSVRILPAEAMISARRSSYVRLRTIGNIRAVSQLA